MDSGVSLLANCPPTASGAWLMKRGWIMQCCSVLFSCWSSAPAHGPLTPGFRREIRRHSRVRLIPPQNSPKKSRYYFSGEQRMKRNQRTGLAKLAFRFVLTIGIVNLFADLTYEGARSITGPFLGSLGASATVIGIVVGLGELLGYSLRSISGFLADKTHRYWLVAFVGYAVIML